MKTDEHKISEFTIYRLSVYKRCLEELEREQIKTVSSKDFAVRFGLNSAQVRKDLAYFGEFGIRGMGYPISTLKKQILIILGLAESAAGEKFWKAIVIGAGNIGTALLNYHDFQTYGFQLVAAFDTDVKNAVYVRHHEPSSGLLLPVPIHSIDQLESVIEKEHPEIAILATSTENAQEIADRLVSAGIHAILNFAPVQILVPSHVTVRTVDLIAELQSLTYHLHIEDIKKQEQAKKKKG